MKILSNKIELLFLRPLSAISLHRINYLFSSQFIRRYKPKKNMRKANKDRISYWICLVLFALLCSCKSPAAGNAQQPDPPGPATQGQLEGETVYLELPHYPLQSEKDLDVLLQAIGDARVVLLGEASHGTSEYYTWRTAITKRL